MLLGLMCNMEGLFKCPLCEVACAYKSTLLSHVNKHDGYPLTCIKCCTSFKNKFAYDYHVYAELCKKSKEQPVLSLQCPECTQSFNNRRHFNAHVEGHKKNNCKYCDVKLTTKKELIQHMAKEHGIKLQRANYQCKYCERCFVKQVTLYNHFNHHANGKFVCQGCGTFLDTKEELESHRERHEQERPWKCTRCATTFSRRQQYVIHMISHDKYQCETCNMGFAAKATLQEHSRACQNQSGKESQHECPECGKIFSRESQLKLHLKAHTGEEAYTCLVCKEGFQTASEYNQHVESTCQKRKKLEDHEKPYECVQCEKRFPLDFLLVDHMNHIHGASQIYKCRYCDLTTNSRANMTRHLALHTEKRRFVCDQCGAAFHAKTTLKDHCISVHSEQRDFSCDTCSKTFKLSSDLRRHIRGHSEVRPFKCQNCNQSYKRVSHLRRHEETTHGTIKKGRRVVRLEQNEKGAFVPANEESKSSVDGDVAKDEETPTVTSETQQWSVPSSSQSAVFASPVLSLVDAESGKVITMQEICNDAQILTSSGNLSAAADDQVAALVSCPDPTLDSFQTGNVMQAIEVTYDLGFTTSQTLTTVLPNAESRLVFGTPIAVSLDANQTVLAVSQIQPSETLEGKVQLLETHASKLPNTIFIEDIKLEPMEEPMLLESAEPDPHITIENFTALQSDVGEAAELDTMLQLSDEVLSSESLLRKRLMSGPKQKPAPPTTMSQCDNMSSIALPSSSLPADPLKLPASSSVAMTPVDISQTNNLISIPSTGQSEFLNCDSTISSLSAGKTTEHSDASKSPLTVYDQDTEMSVQDSSSSHEISSLAMESPITLDEDEPTTVILSALPVDQAAPETDETVTMSTLSVDALGVSISDEDGCAISIQQEDGSTDVVLDMHTEPSLSQSDEVAVATANLMAEFLPQSFPFLNVE